MSTATQRTLKNFYILWIGQQFSLLGSNIAQFVIIWWIAITYTNPVYLGLATFLGFGSFVITSLIGGVYVDRYNRKVIIFTSDTIQALVTSVLIIGFFFGFASIQLVFIILTIRGMLQGFQQPALWAIVPAMVPQEQLTKVNGLDYLVQGLITFCGPLIGAGLLGIFGLNNIAEILLIDVITYLISFIPLLLVYIPNAQKQVKESFATEFKEGLSFIRHTKGLKDLMVIFPFANLFLSPIIVLLPLLVLDRNIFHGNEATLAIALAIEQISFMIGAFIISAKKIVRKNTTGVALGLYIWVLALIVVIVGGYMQNQTFLYVGMFISGFAVPITNVSSQTIWQAVVPLELQGRVNVIRSFFGQGITPISYLLSGFFAALIGSLKVLMFGVLFEIIALTYIVIKTDFRYVEDKLKIANSPNEITA